MSFETIIVEKRNRVLAVALNRPERLNAWTPEMGREMFRAIELADSDDEIGAIVVTGTGRGFCAGADVRDVFARRAATRGQVTDAGRNAPTFIYDWVATVRSAKPMIAAINGNAVGMGITMTLPMDYIITSSAARISFGFVKMGLVPELASSKLLAQRVAPGVAAELVFTGRTIDGVEAQALGLADRVVSPEGLRDAALELGEAIAASPMGTVRRIKRLLTENVGENDLTLVEQRERQALGECYTSPEHEEAIRRFLEQSAS